MQNRLTSLQNLNKTKQARLLFFIQLRKKIILVNYFFITFVVAKMKT